MMSQVLVESGKAGKQIHVMYIVPVLMFYNFVSS